MKRFILIFLICLLTGIDVMAQIWYYIPAGKNAESFNGVVFIIVKDNSGGIWLHKKESYFLKKNLLEDNNYYITAFNESEYFDNHNPFNYTGPTLNMAIPKEKYNMDLRVYDNGSIYFYKLKLKKNETKCSVYAYNRRLIAFSLDFKTMILNPDLPNPSYYTSCSVNNFIVRKSINDLF